MQVTKLKDKFCFCAIGAGGRPCIDRAHCDKNGNRYFAERVVQKTIQRLIKRT